VSLAQRGGQLGRSVTYFSVTELHATVGSTMQHNERRYNADAVLGERTNSNTDAEGVVVQMQQWQWQNHGQQYRRQQCRGWWAGRHIISTGTDAR